MITPDQITITSNLVYEGECLGIGYFYGGTASALLLSDRQLMVHLSDIGFVVDFEALKIKTAYGWIGLSQYMGTHLNKDLAKALVADYLNTRTPKPISQ